MPEPDPPNVVPFPQAVPAESTIASTLRLIALGIEATGEQLLKLGEAQHVLAAAMNALASGFESGKPQP